MPVSRSKEMGGGNVSKWFELGGISTDTAASKTFANAQANGTYPQEHSNVEHMPKHGMSSKIPIHLSSNIRQSVAYTSAPTRGLELFKLSTHTTRKTLLVAKANGTYPQGLMYVKQTPRHWTCSKIPIHHASTMLKSATRPHVPTQGHGILMSSTARNKPLAQ
jgi:hypothetical protein